MCTQRVVREALAVLALVLAIVGLVDVSPASADDAGWTFDKADLAAWAWAPLSPGSVRQGEYRVENNRGTGVRVSLRVVGLVDHENDCLEQETQSPLEDCDSPLGELSHQLHVTITPSGQQPIYDGSLADLVDGSTAVTLPAGGRTLLTFRVELPVTSTNETMSDSVSYAVRADAVEASRGALVSPPLDDGPTSGQVVGASSGSMAGPTAVVHGLLPATGAGVWAFQLASALGLVALGSWLVRPGRGQRARSPERTTPRSPR